MKWNNPQLDAIQQMEYQLLDNPKDKALLTGFIHKSKQWAQIKPLKQQTDEQINKSNI